MAEDRGFQPTRRKLDEARRQGRVLKSQIITQFSVVTAVAAGLVMLVRLIWVTQPKLLNCCFIGGNQAPVECAAEASRSMLLATGGSLAAGAMMAIVVQMLQVGIRFEFSAVGFRLDRLDPVSGLRRMCGGLRSLWRVLLQCAILGAVLCWVVITNIGDVVSVSGLDPQAIRAALFSGLARLVFWGILSGLALGILEYLLNRRAYLRELSMSADEMRREHRENEGDPHVKGARRALHEALVLQDLKKRVRKARLIVVERNE